jgi:acyl dehydratase
MAGTNKFFDDVSVGDDLPALPIGPLTTMHLMRWSAAMENWHRIHYDRAFAVEHDKLPDLLVNGSLKQQFIVKLLKDWASSSGWLWKVSFQFRAMDRVGDVLNVWGKVTGTEKLADYGLVEVDVGIRNDDGKESTPGKAVIALPFKDGKTIPYPFVAPVRERA